jgi:hypothetical protein
MRAYGGRDPFAVGRFVHSLAQEQCRVQTEGMTSERNVEPV